MKAERERELEKELDRFLFDFGRIVLGKDSGGMIVKLKQMRGVSSAWNALKDARLVSDAREYIGAIIRAPQPDPSVSVSEAEYQRLLANWKAKQARTA